MVNPPKRTLHCMAPLALLLLLAPRASMALQSLEVFAAGARQRNPAALEARANLRERGAEADVALGRVLPGISFDGRYARNQYSSEIDLGALGGPNRTIVLLPKNQWNGTATATVPLVDLANFQRIGAARTEAEAAARAHAQPAESLARVWDQSGSVIARDNIRGMQQRGSSPCT